MSLTNEHEAGIQLLKHHFPEMTDQQLQQFGRLCDLHGEWNEKINLTLSVLSSRTIDSGSCLKYQNKYYIPVNGDGIAVHHRKGTKSMVIKSFSGELYSCIGEQVYALELLPCHRPSSKAFDYVKTPAMPKKKYIPPMSHPWKRESFEKYLKKQSHRTTVA